MYRPKHFVLEELVPPDIFKALGEAAWWLLDSRALETADALRDKFGPIIFNTWHSQRLIAAYGRYTESFLRNPTTTTGAKYSQHKFGRAGDAKPTQTTAEKMREYVLAHPSEFPYISGIESGVSWFHFDVRNCEAIKVFPA